MKHDYSQYALPLSIFIGLLLFTLIYLLFKYKDEIKAKNEEIKNLRFLNAENEQRYEAKAEESHKKIVELTHTVNTLDRNASEGTKNQVVTKLEAQQNKRARELRRAGLEEG